MRRDALGNTRTWAWTAKGRTFENARNANFLENAGWANFAEKAF
jgi:hypothetical protein